MRDLIVSLSFDDYGPLIAKEINELEYNKSPIQRTILLVTAREEWLKKLHETIEWIQLNQEYNEEGKEALLELVDKTAKILVTLRYLSIDVVQAICTWRRRLAYLAAKVPMAQDVNIHYFVFLWDSENYLIKMKSDTSFLKDSSIGMFFNFSSKADPFFIIPAQSVSTPVTTNKKSTKKMKKSNKKKKEKSNKPDLVQLDLDFEVVKKIKEWELILVEEAVSEYFISESNITTNTNDENKNMIENEPLPEPITADQIADE